MCRKNEEIKKKRLRGDYIKKLQPSQKNILLWDGNKYTRETRRLLKKSAKEGKKTERKGSCVKTLTG